MKAKLIKVGDHYDLYYRDEVENLIIGFASTDGTFERKLSIKNCEAIERGYDLDELADIEAEKYETRTQKSFKRGFLYGFQKALELMGDKKFSEEDVRKAMESMANLLPLSMIDNYIQSLQQTKWDVEVEMEDIQEIHVDGVLTLQPKLDADGCLILKRIP